MHKTKINNYRWIIVMLLFFATTINYMDRQIIGLLKPILEKEFNWNEIDYAHIIMLFTAGYAIGLLLLGRFIDKVGTKIGYTVSIILWSVAAMLHALARGVFGFCIVRTALGIGEAGNFPAGMKAIAEWFPKKEKAIAAGIFNAGTSIGIVMALLIVPWILTTYGWKQVFWITGALGFIWLIFWLFLYEIPAKQSHLSKKEYALITEGQDVTLMEEEGKTIKWSTLFLFPETWAFITGKLFIDPIYWFFLFWLPSYFSSIFHLDMTKPSLPLMIIYAATTIGSIGGGYISSGLIKKGWPVLKARKASLLIFAILEFSIILVQFTTDIRIAVGLLSLAVAVHQAWATNIFTMASDMFPPKSVSSVVGIGGMAGAIGGVLFPIIVGYLLATYKMHGNIAGGYNVLFTLCGSTYLFTWMIIHLLTNRPKRKAIGPST